MKRVSDYLAWLGGADLFVLEQVPTERVRFIQTGLTLITTAGIAVVSMFFAVHYGLLGNWAASILIAIFWGAIILNLDRLMMLSIGRTRNRKQLLLMVVPRLVLGVLVGFVVSLPLVLRIFSPEINAQLTATHKSHGIISQLQVLSDLTKNSTSARLAFFLLIFLFLLIELLPLLVKLLLNFSPMTAYERVAEAREEQFIEQARHENRVKARREILAASVHDISHDAVLERDLAASLDDLAVRYEDNGPGSLINELLARQNAVTQGPQPKLTEPPSKDGVAFIRELAHSLNTPLSQIEAAALLLPDDSREDSATAPCSKTPARRIYQSVEICKAFLAAFMQITKVASQTSEWNPKSLQASLHAAVALYAEKARSGVKSRIHIDVEPRGYPASYIIAVTLPVIENAFESAKPGSTVSIEITAEPREYRIQVSSTYETTPEVDSMYRTGFTTKADHQGIGLSVVQRLLSAYQGARITHEIIEGQIGFVISLPRGKE
jgi:signal transduction histidine kinase